MENSELNKLGQKLEIYTVVDYIGKGFPIILPNGAKIIRTIRNFVEDEQERNRFYVVRTPSASRAEIYSIEDRLQLIKNNIFAIKSNNENEQEKNTIVLKPYSQPFHCSIYTTKQHTYKEMPVKYCETSTVFRNERDPNGIVKSRQFTLSDASIFSDTEFFDRDLKNLIIMQKEILDRLGLDVTFEVQNWKYEEKENYIGQIEEWHRIIDIMKYTLHDLKIKFTENKKARLYGPSISIKYNSRELSNIQVDFEIVHRFDLKFINKNNEEEFPIYTHVNTVGSYENIVMILLEKYEGDFPLWIAPTQVEIIPEGEEFEDYAREVRKALFENTIRVNIDNASGNFQNKLYRAVDLKVPYIVTIGKKEYQNKTLRVRKGDSTRNMKLEDLIEEVKSCLKKS